MTKKPRKEDQQPRKDIPKNPDKQFPNNTTFFNPKKKKAKQSRLGPTPH